jgi:N-acetylneuraminate synthase
MNTTVIAEIGLNHNGDPILCRRLIQAAKNSGATYVKFQLRSNKLYRNSNIYNEDLSTQYIQNIISKYDLADKTLFDMFDYAKAIDIQPICTPFDIESANKLNKYGINIFKIASCDLTNTPLIKQIISFNKKIFCSTGMSSEQDIIDVCNILGSADYNLLHCNSTYPTPYKDINLKYINKLKDISKRNVGYSGHERGYVVPLAAVALGATIIEKHITLTPDAIGNDHKVSLSPQQFSTMVDGIQNIEDSLGTTNPRIITGGELVNRSGLAKSIIAKRHIKKEEVITLDMLDIKSPGGGLQPNQIDKLVGTTIRRDVAKNAYLFPSDLLDEQSSTCFKFKSKWGFPVRFHDYKYLLEVSNPDFVEFHLTYQDVNLDIDKALEQQKLRRPHLGVTVHAPDIFEDDHLLDIASLNKQHLQESVRHLQRTVNITKKIKTYFNVGRVKLILSSGCMTTDRFIKEKYKPICYKQVADIVGDLQDDDVEIIMQTLPPFPWYFGGQYYLSVFTQPEEIATFCSKYNIGLCFDTSHAQMSCNYHNIDFNYYIKLIKPYIRHLHLSDAIGVDNEGVQIGDGDVDFKEVSKLNIPSFIPEIWRGHENNYTKMWEGLNKLQQWF